MKINWELTHLFANQETWEKELKILKINVKKLLEKLEENRFEPLSFITLLEDKVSVNEKMEHVYVYPRRHLDLDSSNELYNNMFKDVLLLYNEIQKMDHLFEQYVIQYRESIMAIANTQIDYYKRYLESIWRKNNHILGKEEIRITTEYTTLHSSFAKIYRSLIEEELKFGKMNNGEGKEVVVNRVVYNELLLSENEEIRRKAYQIHNQAYQGINRTMSHLYDAKIEKELVQSKLEGFSSILDKKMFLDELPNGIVSRLIQHVQGHLGVMHDWITLKKSQLQLDAFHAYDSMLSIQSREEKKYSLEEAISIVKTSLQPMGEDYISHVDKAFGEGWIDVYSKKNKRKGAYSCITYSGAPYTLLNYDGNLSSVRTLIHELGHAFHTTYAKNQQFIYFEYSLFLAEVAAKIHELFLNDYLLETAKTKEDKIDMLNQVISNMIGTLFGQTMLTEFEHAAIEKKEQGEIISPTYLNELYEKIVMKYNGPSYASDEENQYGWSRIPHYYLYDSYYVYQYAIGLSLAISIWRKIKTQPGYVNQYIEFLSIGNRKNIEESLKLLDIDLLDEQYLEDAFLLLQEKMEELKTLIKS